MYCLDCCLHVLNATGDYKLKCIDPFYTLHKRVFCVLVLSGLRPDGHKIFWVQIKHRFQSWMHVVLFFPHSCLTECYLSTHFTTARYKGVCIVMPHPGISNKYLKVALGPTSLDQSVSQVLVGPYCLEHVGSCLGLPWWLADSKSLDNVVNNRGQLWDNTVLMINIHFWLPWDMMLIISWALASRLCLKERIFSSCSNKYLNTKAVSSISFILFWKKYNIWNFYFGFLFGKLYYYYLTNFAFYCLVWNAVYI